MGSVLVPQRGKQPTVVGWGCGGCTQHSPWDRTGQGAFLGLCLPVRDLRECQSIRAVLVSCQIHMFPPAQVRRDFSAILSGSVETK